MPGRRNIDIQFREFPATVFSPDGYSNSRMHRTRGKKESNEKKGKTTDVWNAMLQNNFSICNTTVETRR